MVYALNNVFLIKINSFLRRWLHQDREKQFLDRNRWFSYRENSELPRRFRSSRQLIVSGPAYGFSGYFKPVILEAFDGMLWIVCKFNRELEDDYTGSTWFKDYYV